MAYTRTPMICHSVDPLNAEPQLDALIENYVTPVDVFYIRAHGTIPAMTADDYRLHVSGRVSNARDYSFDELRLKFAKHTVTATLQCAGNRRAGLGTVRPVDGQPWQAGAIGNAIWSGVKLADVLYAVGCSSDDTLHVEFVSCDVIEMNGEQFPYAVSIPVGKAMSPEVLLAWEMNGSPLTREHGFPLRAIVPGYAGVRSPKWLTGISVIENPSQGYMQRNDYQLFPPSSRTDNPDRLHAMTINALPLNAAICEPAPHANLAAGRCTVRGYAVATRDTAVSRVDVSQDDGRTWLQAELESHTNDPWSWTRWEITLDLSSGEQTLVVRAWDESGQTQPALPDDTWNFKGYLNSSWHRVTVNVR